MKRVVVTGIGAVTPIGNDVGTFRSNLQNGVSGIASITRFDTADWKYKLAAEVKNFDPLNRLDKTTVRKTDRFVQYALYAADEAMELSGISGTVDRFRLGVYFGSGIGGFETFCEDHRLLLEYGIRKVSPQFISKMISNIAAGNIAIRYGANGPCLSVTTACATGTTAIGEAFRAIRFGYADAIICGGSEAAITPLSVAGFGNCMALTSSDNPNAASLPFDRRRAGFVLGEGAAALILEEYEHAVNRNAHIYAEICGYGSTCDAHHVTAPDPEAESSARAISDAVKEAGLERETRIYINAHGTGTPLNDKTETLAIKKALGDTLSHKIKISSTKSMTGHMLGAAGAAEAIACIFTLESGVIAPTINLLEPDPECDLDYCKGEGVQMDVNCAISNSLGFGGHNATICMKKITD